MTFNDLALEIARREGKKVSVNIAQIREILSVLIQILSGPDGTQKFRTFVLAMLQQKSDLIANRPKSRRGRKPGPKKGSKKK